MFPHVFPAEFTRLPPELSTMSDVPTLEELTENLNIRRKQAFDSERDTYTTDVGIFSDFVRAFRAVKGTKCYVEIGTYDKGNLAYVASLLDDSAMIIDVDIEAHEEQVEKLRRALKPHQTYHQVVGNSLLPETADRVRALIESGSAGADAVFIDGNHVAEAVITDYALYAPLVREGGLVMFHDIYWTGFDEYLGAGQAIEILDKVRPVFAVSGDRPISRYIPILRRGTVWGGIGVVVCGPSRPRKNWLGRLMSPRNSIPGR